MPTDSAAILAIERPHKKLMRLYWLRSLVFPPFSLVMLPFLYFRYHTMRYRFDDEGVSMRWGALFRREASLTYERIQDIHLTSNLVQRWLGLGTVQLQTASGTAKAEVTIEGLQAFEAIRDFLYTRMRGATVVPQDAHETEPATADDTLVETLRQVVAELRGLRADLAATDPRRTAPTGPEVEE